MIVGQSSGEHIEKYSDFIKDSTCIFRHRVWGQVRLYQRVQSNQDYYPDYQNSNLRRADQF